MKYGTRPDEDDGTGSIVPLCREYICSRAHPQSRVYGAIRGWKIIGPVIEVRIVKMLEEYGLEISIPFTFNPIETSYVVISRETMRLVDETHGNKKELRSSSELLTALKNRRRRIQSH